METADFNAGWHALGMFVGRCRRKLAAAQSVCTRLVGLGVVTWFCWMHSERETADYCTDRDRVDGPIKFLGPCDGDYA